MCSTYRFTVQNKGAHGGGRTTAHGGGQQAKRLTEQQSKEIMAAIAKLLPKPSTLKALHAVKVQKDLPIPPVTAIPPLLSKVKGLSLTINSSKPPRNYKDAQSRDDHARAYLKGYPGCHGIYNTTAGYEASRNTHPYRVQAWTKRSVRQAQGPAILSRRPTNRGRQLWTRVLVKKHSSLNIGSHDTRQAGPGRCTLSRGPSRGRRVQV